MTLSSRKKGVKQAPYDGASGSTSAAIADGISTLTSMWEKCDSLQALPDLIMGRDSSPVAEKETKNKWYKKRDKAGKAGVGDEQDSMAKYITISRNMLNWYLSLDAQTQRYVSWSFLGFLVMFSSGLWTLKIALATFLLLFKPFETHQPQSNSGKGKSRSKDSSKGRGIVTYGNVAASDATETQEKVLDDDDQDKESISQSAPVPSESQRPLPPPPLPSTLCSSASASDSIVPTQESLHQSSSSSSLSSPSSSTDTMETWQRKPSGSFHRIEVAKKFVNRKFGRKVSLAADSYDGSQQANGQSHFSRSVSMPVGCHIEEEDPLPEVKEVLRESLPTEQGWAAEAVSHRVA
ncbi:unnamed protein product [Sympodiomycopsis kandeliae]